MKRFASDKSKSQLQKVNSKEFDGPKFQVALLGPSMANKE
jgi:hypothetical protein